MAEVKVWSEVVRFSLAVKRFRVELLDRAPHCRVLGAFGCGLILRTVPHYKAPFGQGREREGRRETAHSAVSADV
jgi:hypothetical protein